MNILDLLKSYHAILAIKQANAIFLKQLYHSDEHLREIVKSQDEHIDKAISSLQIVIRGQFPASLMEVCQAFEREKALGYIVSTMDEIRSTCQCYSTAAIECFAAELLNLIDTLAKPRREKDKYAPLFNATKKVLEHLEKSKDTNISTWSTSLLEKVKNL